MKVLNKKQLIVKAQEISLKIYILKLEVIENNNNDIKSDEVKKIFFYCSKTSKISKNLVLFLFNPKKIKEI